MMTTPITMQVRSLTCGGTDGVEFEFCDMGNGARVTAWVPSSEGGVRSVYGIGTNLPQYMDAALQSFYQSQGGEHRE